MSVTSGVPVGQADLPQPSQTHTTAQNVSCPASTMRRVANTSLGTRLEKDRDGCPRVINVSGKTGLEPCSMTNVLPAGCISCRRILRTKETWVSAVFGYNDQTDSSDNKEEEEEGSRRDNPMLRFARRHPAMHSLSTNRLPQSLPVYHVPREHCLSVHDTDACHQHDAAVVSLTWPQSAPFGLQRNSTDPAVNHTVSDVVHSGEGV